MLFEPSDSDFGFEGPANADDVGRVIDWDNEKTDDGALRFTTIGRLIECI